MLSVLLCMKQLQLLWVLDWLALELLSLLPVLLCVQQPQLPLGAQLACTRKHTELLWRLLLVLSVLLCVKQPQLPWVLDWLALELLSVPSVLLCVKQLQLLWVLGWLALELLSVLSVLLCEQQRSSRACRYDGASFRAERRRTPAVHMVAVQSAHIELLWRCAECLLLRAISGLLVTRTHRAALAQQGGLPLGSRPTPAPAPVHRGGYCA